MLHHKSARLKCVDEISERCFEFFKFSNANLLKEEINSKFWNMHWWQPPFALHCDFAEYQNWTAWAVDIQTSIFERIFMLCDDARWGHAQRYTQPRAERVHFFSAQFWSIKWQGKIIRGCQKWPPHFSVGFFCPQPPHYCHPTFLQPPWQLLTVRQCYL